MNGLYFLFNVDYSFYPYSMIKLMNLDN